jgi:hypothetical protein
MSSRWARSWRGSAVGKDESVEGVAEEVIGASHQLFDLSLR